MESVGSFTSRHLRDLCGDDECEESLRLAFTSKNIESGGYSTGSTFFIGSNEAPSCFLEHLALEVFAFHAKRLGIQDLKNGGAEWWSQVIHSDDDIGWHWDRDYGKEEEGEYVYPDLATVTYFRSLGGATVVTSCRGAAGDLSSSSVGYPIGTGKLERMSVSKPRKGKHLYFTGDLLHGAPSNLSRDVVEVGVEEDDGDDEEGSDEDDDSEMRITFLVNCWFDRRPIQAARLPEEIRRKMKFSNTSTNVFAGIDANQLRTVELTNNLDHPRRTWEFSDCKRKYELSLPLREKGGVDIIDRMGEGETLEIIYNPSNGVKGIVALRDMGEVSDQSGNEESEGEQEEAPTKRARLDK